MPTRRHLHDRWPPRLLLLAVGAAGNELAEPRIASAPLRSSQVVVEACSTLQELELPPFDASCRECYKHSKCLGLAQRHSDGYPMLLSDAGDTPDGKPSCGCYEIGKHPSDTCKGKAEACVEAVHCMSSCFGFKEGSFVEAKTSEIIIDEELPHLPKGELRASGMFDYHKELLPLDHIDYFTFMIAAVGLLIAAGGGIGGGGVLVPLFMILLRFRPKHAIALSNLTIFGGSIANVTFNLPKRRPNGKSMIDWDIIVIMEPATIAGAVLGSYASKYLPDFVLTACLTIVLGVLSHRTLEKGTREFRKETEAIQRKMNDTATTGSGTMMVGNYSQAEQDDPELVQDAPQHDNSIPWTKVNLLVVCFVGCVILTVFKGSGSGSIIGVECGTPVFWLLSFGAVPWVIFFQWFFRRMLVAETEQHEKDGHTLESDEIKWDDRSTITYPMICTLAGLFAGLFGVGGGIVKGPLMLEMGVNPSVAAATAATMIFFTSSAACVSFLIFELLEPEYGIAVFCMGFVFTSIGQSYMSKWMKASGRQSPPILSIGGVMALSTLLVAIEAYMKFSSESTSELFAPSSICAQQS